MGGLYHQSLEEERAPALRRFGAQVARALALPVGGLQFVDWDEALRAALRSDQSLVVIDEFPYLLRHSPELPSVVQRVYDDARAGEVPALRLVLCGSAMSVMAQLLSGTKALRGRATLDLPLQPFDFRESRRFRQIEDLDVALHLHAILGGTPGYRDLLEGDVPNDMSDLADWLARGVLNPSNALFREADYLLTEEPSVSDRALYHSVLTAISRGDRTPSKVAATLGRDESSLRHALATLERGGLVERAEDPLRRRRATLRLTDPILRFAHLVVRPNLARLEQREAVAVWRDSPEGFAAQVLGPHFEGLARTWVERFASEETLGGRVQVVGTTTVNDPARRMKHEVDVLGLGARAGSASRQALLLGEAKAGVQPRDLRDLRRLEHIRVLLSANERLGAASAKLGLFARGGFAGDLLAEVAGRDDIVLVDLNRLYEGS